MEDKAANPSNYAMITVSEGATIEGGEMHLSGEADAYGHRKLGGIGRTTGELLKERTGQGIIFQEVAYLMRSGRPDSLDLMVATNYAVMAADLALEGSSGRMVALRSGDLHERARLGHRRGRQTGRRRRALRRRASTAPRSATSAASRCSSTERRAIRAAGQEAAMPGSGLRSAAKRLGRCAPSTAASRETPLNTRRMKPGSGRRGTRYPGSG